MSATVTRYTRDVIESQGWTPGSTLENRFALRLHRIGIRPGDLLQQHTVGRYRLDFADPDVLIAIEADGFYHRMPGAADRDRTRDQWLLTQGWFVFRVADDCDEHQLEERLCAAVLLIRAERIDQGRSPRRVGQTSRQPPKPSRLAVAAGCIGSA